MNKPVCRSRRRASLEAQPLLPPFTQNTARIRRVPLCCSPGGFCMTSKATILVLLWTVFVGALYIISSVGFWYLISLILQSFTESSLLIPYYVVLCGSSALCFIFYPLSGYFADVCCGRFKTITASLALLLCSVFLSLISGMLYLSPVGNTSKLVQFTIWLSCLITAIIGVAGYSANFIQFGLDQLLDAPSHQQALFVHWAKWCYDLMSIVIILLGIMCHACDVIAQSFNTLLEIIVSTVILLELMLTILLIVGCCKRHWFYSEPGHHNPYKMVIKVLNFARKHDYPLQRSAFTYCDDERPSRLDFGKQRFGGPFTTEQVEDVKTFLRIVVILLAVGPVLNVFADTPSSDFFFIFLNLHFTSSEALCSWNRIIINGGVLRRIVSTIFITFYIWIVFSVLRNRVPKILYRLGFGMLLHFLGVVYVFVVDTTGHALYQGNDTQCILWFVPTSTGGYYDVSSLDMHWAVNIPTNFLFGIGSTLVTATIFEFISAQSPQSMKGLLLGTYYALTGIFQFITFLSLVPFISDRFLQHYGQTGCLFGYLVTICVLTFIGLVVFAVAATKYRYRERDDQPYDQRFVIDVYSRYLNHTRNDESYSDGESG